MRIKNSLKNIGVSIITQVVMIILGFISRKVFLDSLGTEYLGINGLLTNILSMLSLVEGGIGVSIVYNLYKPLAENDTKQIIALVQLYKKLYIILSIIIGVISIGIYPLLNIFVKDGLNIPYIGVVYFIFVFRNIISYLNAHKWSLINADQKGYIISKYSIIFNIITTISKIVVLTTSKNYILYLIIDVIIFTIQTILNGKIVNNIYPYIKTKKKYRIDRETSLEITKNVKALFLHNIGSYCIFGTDNLLISSLIGIRQVGIYSNYIMITQQLDALLNPILNGIKSSIGNLIATESSDKKYKIFKVSYFINFWIYSVGVIFLYNLLEPFINWWLGEGLLIDSLAFNMILVNLYLTGMRNSIGNFKTSAGIFDQDKYAPIIESIINLTVSIILSKYFGLAGIIIGTTISTICLPFWTTPTLVYKYVFKQNVLEYFKQYFYYVVSMILNAWITTNICNFVSKDVTFINLIIKGMVCVIISNIIYIVIFKDTTEFKYVINIFKSMISKLKEKYDTRLARHM